ncbi:unnamed protein product [Alopecurus aequalis]
MRRVTVKRWGPRRCAGQTSGSAGGGAVAVDRLSALPDALLHHIMSSLKAWEVEFRDFVHRLFLLREVSAPVDTLRLRSSNEDAGFDENDANIWIRAAINRRARVIHLAGHRRDRHWITRLAGHHKEVVALDRVSLVSRHLKVLKLSYTRLDGSILQQLPSGCTSLEELDLKDCLVTGHEIVSASLKTLIMVKCKFTLDFSIAAPNLVLLRLITPYVRVPSFKNFGSLVTGTIILDDYYLGDDYEHISDKDDCDETTDDDGDDSDADYKRQSYKVRDDSSLSDDDFGYINDDDDFGKFGYGHGFPQQRYGHDRYKDNYDYGTDIDSDDNTYEYGEIANDPKYGYKGKSQIPSKGGNYGENSGGNDSRFLGGRHIFESLSSATSLEFLTDAGEVVLTRELKRCPTFSNLKTLSLGEWCMAADFDALIFLLQRSPNIERLFLQLKLYFGTRMALQTGVKPMGRSFTCKDLRMVKIKCSKDDGRVHTLAQMFRENGVPLEKIYVRRSGNTLQ